MNKKRIFISYSPKEFLEFEKPHERYSLIVSDLQEKGFEVVNDKLELNKYDYLSKRQLHIKISDELFDSIDFIYCYKPSYEHRYCYLHRRYARDFKVQTYVEKQKTSYDLAFEEWWRKKCQVPITKLAAEFGVSKKRLITFLLKENRNKNPECIYNFYDKENAEDRGEGLPSTGYKGNIDLLCERS